MPKRKFPIGEGEARVSERMHEREASGSVHSGNLFSPHKSDGLIPSNNAEDDDHLVEDVTPVSDQAAGSTKNFFDLPREVRDTIYQYITRAMYALEEHLGSEDPKLSSLCDCRRHPHIVYRPHPPRFAYYQQSCLVLDRWLHSISMIGGQFSKELLANFFRNAVFKVNDYAHSRLHPSQQVHWDSGIRLTPFTEPLLANYATVFHALGIGSLELRRVFIDFYAVVPFTADDVDLDADLYNAFKVEDAEQELETLRGILHPNATLVFCMHKRLEEKGHRRGQLVSYFDCKVSPSDQRVYVAQELGSDGYQQVLDVEGFQESDDGLFSFSED